MLTGVLMIDPLISVKFCRRTFCILFQNFQNPLLLPAVTNQDKIEIKTGLHVHHRRSLDGFLGNEFCLVENRTRIL